MALYRPGEVNCGHCKEPQGTTAEDYNGRVQREGVLVLTLDPCMRCAVHTYGMLGRCDDDCPDCEENHAEAAETVMVELHVINAYDDGSEIVTEPAATVPRPYTDDEGALSDWWQEHIFPLTGTGHSAGNAIYDVTITASDMQALVGLTYEFG